MFRFWNGSVKYSSIDTTVVSNNTETHVHTLSSTYTKRGETWTGESWCGDSYSNSSKDNDSVTIQNTVPVINSNISIPTSPEYSNSTILK